MRIEGYLPQVGRATKGGSLPYNSSNGNGATAHRVYNRFSERAGAEGTRLEIGSRHHLHSPRAADLAAADNLAHGNDATRFAGTDLLPPKACRPWRKTFFYLEVPDNEGEC